MEQKQKQKQQQLTNNSRTVTHPSTNQSREHDQCNLLPIDPLLLNCLHPFVLPRMPQNQKQQQQLPTNPLDYLFTLRRLHPQCIEREKQILVVDLNQRRKQKPSKWMET